MSRSWRPRERSRLAILARVIAMGGSGHDGEALAALRQADRSIRDAGMTWHDVLLPGRLIEALAAEVQQLRDELTGLRAAKAAETQQLVTHSPPLGIVAGLPSISGPR